VIVVKCGKSMQAGLGHLCAPVDLGFKFMVSYIFKRHAEEILWRGSTSRVFVQIRGEGTLSAHESKAP
jgi:hypothetical protein